MLASRVLEMIQAGRIEELIQKCRDEIYTNSLRRKPNAKKRYSAMKKYFTYADSIREVCKRPYPVEFEGVTYTSFTNSYSLALTTEDIGEIELFNTENGDYPDVTRLIHFDGEAEKINLTRVIAEAKSLGYKLRKPQFFSNGYLMHYKGAYYRIPLLETTYNIIADGDEVTVYKPEGNTRPLVMQNDIGIAMVLPVRYEHVNPEDNGNIVIEAIEKEEDNAELYELQ